MWSLINLFLNKNKLHWKADYFLYAISELYDFALWHLRLTDILSQNFLYSFLLICVNWLRDIRDIFWITPLRSCRHELFLVCPLLQLTDEQTQNVAPEIP